MPAALVALFGALAGSASIAIAQEAKPPLVEPVKTTTIVPADAVFFG